MAFWNQYAALGKWNNPHLNQCHLFLTKLTLRGHLLYMDEIYFALRLAFTRESSSQGFLGGAGFGPSTVDVLLRLVWLEIGGTGLDGFYAIFQGQLLIPKGHLWQGTLGTLRN